MTYSAVWLWYDAVVRHEERFLERSFPEEWARYARTTRRWLPALRWHRRPSDLAAYSLRRALHRERGPILTLAGAVAAIVLLRLGLG